MPRTHGNKKVFLINAIATGLGGYAIWFSLYKVELPPHLAGAGQWQFLTQLSLAASLVVFAIGLAAHGLHSPALFLLKNALHPIAMILETVVTTIYWPLRLFLVHKLVKDPTRKHLPLSIDFCMHLVPFVALFVDYIFFMPKWTISSYSAFVICGALCGSYYLWLRRLVDVANGGEYPYEFLNVPDELTRIMIFGAVALLAFAFFLSLRALYTIVVGDSAEQDLVKKSQ